MIVILPIALVAVFLYARRRAGDRAVAPEVGPLGWVAGTDWDVVAPLARRNSMRLLRHPAFLSGVALSPLIFAAGGTEVNHTWLEVSGLIALGLAPFGWFVIIATNLLANRPARTGADELFASLPAPQPARTLGLLFTAVPAAATAALIAIAEVVFVSQTDWVLAGSPRPLEIAAGVLLAVGAVAVGVSLGRYFGHPVFGTAGVFVVIFLQSRFESGESWPWNSDEASPLRFLTFLGPGTSAPVELQYRPAAWHLLYLVGLIALMVCVALVRDGFPKVLRAGFAGVAVVLGVTGFMQLQPMPSSRTTEMVAFLEEPKKHQHCEVTDRARFCYFAKSRGEVKTWMARTTDVLALLPADALPRRIEVVDRVPTVVGNRHCSPIPFAASLPGAVAKQLDPEVVWPKDDAIHPGTDTWGCSSDSVHGFFYAVQLASHALGLPSSPHGDDLRCASDSDERAMYALWLGAAASPEGEETLSDLANEHQFLFSFEGWDNPPMWGVEFTRAQADSALGLLRRPAAEVKAELASKWDALSTPPAALRCT